MVTTVLALSALLVPSSEVPLITGSVTYRERMALPADAVLTVALDQFEGGEQTNVSEVKMALNGQQVPVMFGIPFTKSSIRSGAQYGMRAEIRSQGRVWFESPRHTMVIANDVYQVRLDLVKAAPMVNPVLNTTWELFWMNGRMITASRPPSMRLDSAKSELTGFTGVNRFSGRFTYTAPTIQLDPGAMTMMAGSTAAMEVEKQFLDVMMQSNRATVFEGELTLSRGESELAKFRKARTQTAGN